MGTQATETTDDPARRRRPWPRRRRRAEPEAAPAPVRPALPEDFDIGPGDPLLRVAQSSPGPIDLRALSVSSPAVDRLREAGVVLVVPLVSSGELIGLMTLGPRLSERDYSVDDKRLLSDLAGHAAPAMRVGQLVRQQEDAARERERIDAELRVAQLIQQQFLPRELPDLGGWDVAAFYRPARTVGGDFYDFIELPDGRVMVVAGDVTDKGVPAALVMASTHALLRSAGPALVSPGAVLAHVNDMLHDDIPDHMFVTCLAMVLDPDSGSVVFANAGHNVPYVKGPDGVVELKARGMPLGLMPGMDYEERKADVPPGHSVLLHSDGLAEAHGPDGHEMFGFPRLGALVQEGHAGQALIDRCMSELNAFTGPDVEQEDDITLVVLDRTGGSR